MNIKNKVNITLNAFRYYCSYYYLRTEFELLNILLYYSQVGEFEDSVLFITNSLLPSLYTIDNNTCDSYACQQCIVTQPQEHANYIHGDLLIGGEQLKAEG